MVKSLFFSRSVITLENSIMGTRCGAVKHSLTTINVDINVMIDDGRVYRLLRYF